MDEEIKTPHSEEFDKLCAEKKAVDGLGNVNPDVHLFCEQSKADVLKMFKQIEEAKKQQDFCGIARPLAEDKTSATYAGIMDAPAHHKPHLLYEDAKSCGQWGPSFERKCYEKVGESEAPETVALWRRLSGVNPQENVEAAKQIPTIMDTILLLCKRNFVSGLTVEWSTDDWNPCLIINGAKTKIKSDDLVAALEGLQHITDEDDAARIVSNVVVKKLERLFI